MGRLMDFLNSTVMFLGCLYLTYLMSTGKLRMEVW